jgi:hypothetical protein
VKTAVAVALLFLPTLLYGQACQCTFSVPTSPVVGIPVEFSATCPQPPTVTWSFGDGSNATGATVRHTYTAPNQNGLGAPTNYEGKVLATTASGTCANYFYINAVEPPAAQCSFCTILASSAGEVGRYIPFTGSCTEVASYTLWYGDGASVSGLQPSPPFLSTDHHTYNQPGVYNWKAHMESRNGDTCEPAGQITISGCEVVSLTIDPPREVKTQSVKLQWTTNGAFDCQQGGEYASFRIDADNAEIDSVPATQFSRALGLSWASGGYHILSVRRIVCTACLCGAGCAPSLPGYDRAANEQAIDVLTDANCAPVEITQQPMSQTHTGSPVTLTAASSAVDAKYDWHWMPDSHDDISTLVSESRDATLNPYRDGFYWVDATSPCGSSARSQLVAVCSPPQITNQPQSQAVESGHNVVLVAIAQGTEITFQWYSGTRENRTPISGGSPVVTSPGTSSLDTGPLIADRSFFVEASDACGNVVASELATVTVQTVRHRPVRH